MVLSICIVAGFRSTNDIGNAYGKQTSWALEKPISRS
jgi:hypothetical protein